MEIVTLEGLLRLTQSEILSWNELEAYRANLNLTPTTWRQIGDWQKHLHKQQLAAQYGATKQVSTIPFEFRNADMLNLFQLEAIVEFFVQRDDGNAITTHTTNVDFLSNSEIPQLVIIDSFGGRVKGSSAQIVHDVPNCVQLDANVDELRLNANFDTIYLANDQARASQSYRIQGIIPNSNQVLLDGQPVLDDAPTVWRIPAGLGGELPPLDYNLGPGVTSEGEFRGWDHYHGVLFVVQGGRVYPPFRWTSYSSRNLSGDHNYLSSLLGNRAYRFHSHCANTVSAINYAFWVTNLQPPDEPVPARFYFAEAVTSDLDIREPYKLPGKTQIMIHIGWTATGQSASGDGTGSAGCLVSPDFYKFRDLLIELHQQTLLRQGLAADPALTRLQGLSHVESVQLWMNTKENTGTPDDQLDIYLWKNKIIGTLWLVRPDERPLTQTLFANDHATQDSP